VFVFGGEHSVERGVGVEEVAVMQEQYEVLWTLEEELWKEALWE
jgi:hypothetical protein